MWRKIFKDVFPNMPIKRNIDKEKKEIAKKIDRIRVFRNRIFHYEPIFNRDDLDEIHKDILDVIGWINHELLILTKMFDNYENIIIGEQEIVKKISKFRGKDG